MVVRKYVHKNVSPLAANMLYKSPLMTDDLLRASPEFVTQVSNGHIIAILLLTMCKWMQLCYKSRTITFGQFKIINS